MKTNNMKTIGNLTINDFVYLVDPLSTTFTKVKVEAITNHTIQISGSNYKFENINSSVVDKVHGLKDKCYLNFNDAVNFIKENIKNKIIAKRNEIKDIDIEIDNLYIKLLSYGIKEEY
jgi:hypothetical protein